MILRLQRKKKELDELIDCDKNRIEISAPERKLIPKMQDSEFSNLLEEVLETDKESGLLKISNYSKVFQPKSVCDDIPNFLSNLFNPSFVQAELYELQDIIESNFININISTEHVKIVEELTRGQAKNSLWFKLRTGRITASIMKLACRTNIENPSLSLLNRICYPSETFECQSTKWGKDNEKRARKLFTEQMSKYHKNFKVRDCGLILNELHPSFGASPDGFAKCDCCGEGIIEIKCPFKFRDSLISDFLSHSNSCLELVDGDVSLKKDHGYMYQIQTQIHMSNMFYGYFVLWTKKDMHIEMVQKDDVIWNEICDKGKKFFKNVVLPELLGHYFSHPRNDE